MPCDSCGVQFTVFRLKRVCAECERFYCSGCLRRGGGAMCAPCRLMSTRPLFRQSIAHLKVRDLQCFLQRHNVSTRGCVEKDELVSLCVAHVNSAAYRRRSNRFGGSFSSFKGITNNINVFITSAFDLRNGQQPNQTPGRGTGQEGRQYSQFLDLIHSSQQQAGANSPGHQLRMVPALTMRIRTPAVHTAAPSPRSAVPSAPEPTIQLTSTAGSVAAAAEATGGGAAAAAAAGAASPHSGGARSPSSLGGRVDTADCYEIEDLDEGWEFVHTPASPLPNDSAVLLAESPGGAARAASALELRPPASAAPSDTDGDTASLRDEPCCAPRPPAPHPAPRLAPCAAPRGEPPEQTTEHRQDSTTQVTDSSRQEDRRSPTREENSTEEPDLNGFVDASREDYEPVDHVDRDRSAGHRSEPFRDSGNGTPRRVLLRELATQRDVEALSVRQLKDLLAVNNVEYRGCVERAELLSRALTLWRDHSHYRDKIDSLPLEECCKICMSAPLECVLLECGHVAACTACARQLPECPICRQFVVRAVRFFRS